MLEQLKKEVVRIAKLADDNGLCKHGSGNFSIRDEDSGYIVITPSAVSRDELTYEHVCVIDLDGKIIEKMESVRPSSESLMHLEVYKTRSDLKSIAHTHSKFATTFAVLDKEIPPITYESIAYGAKLPIAPYGRPGTVDLAKSIVEPLKESDCCLMSKHGVLATSVNNLYDAFLKAVYIEEVAEIYYRAITINPGIGGISQDEFDKWAYPEEIEQ
jgi:L-fuculose-phosphate aldolase